MNKSNYDSLKYQKLDQVNQVTNLTLGFLRLGKAAAIFYTKESIFLRVLFCKRKDDSCVLLVLEVEIIISFDERSASSCMSGSRSRVAIDFQRGIAERLP
eukprot:g79902.t1